jgi:hypothetical protein
LAFALRFLLRKENRVKLKNSCLEMREADTRPLVGDGEKNARGVFMYML